MFIYEGFICNFHYKRTWGWFFPNRGWESGDGDEDRSPGG